MGFEYQIQYQPKDRIAWEHFVARLDNPIENGWPAFRIELTEDGVYFCDHGRSAAAAVALRRIVDEIIAHKEPVRINEV